MKKSSINNLIRKTRKLKKIEKSKKTRKIKRIKKFYKNKKTRKYNKGGMDREQKYRRDDHPNINRKRSRSRSPSDKKPTMAEFLQKMIEQDKQRKEKAKKNRSKLNPQHDENLLSDALKKYKI